jgi:hypothetical protein
MSAGIYQFERLENINKDKENFTLDINEFYYLNGLLAKEWIATNELLFDNRNYLWLPKIEDYHTNLNDALFAVGAGHLFGNNGLIKLLTQKGYSFKKIDISAVYKDEIIFNDFSLEDLYRTEEQAIYNDFKYQITKADLLSPEEIEIIKKHIKHDEDELALEKLKTYIDLYNCEIQSILGFQENIIAREMLYNQDIEVQPLIGFHNDIIEELFGTIGVI